MLKWEIKNGDEKLKEEINRVKNDFDNWFNNSWAKRCTREQMLSKNSPLQHVYYKMTKSPEEIKEKYPYETLQKCSSCGEYVDIWIETEFSFCNEYGCGMTLCKKCVNELKNLIDRI